MRSSVIAIIALSLFITPAFAQIRAVEAGSAEAAQRLEEFQRKIQAEAREWKEAVKLTVLEKLPDSPRESHECLQPGDLKEGQLGYLEYWHTEILQVVGPTDVLLTLGSAKFPPVWLRNYPTRELADGQIVRIVGLVRVEGTKSYTTAAGAKKTVRVAQLVSREESPKLEKEVQAKMLAEQEKRLAEIEEKKYREWKDSKGEVKAVAKFLDFKNGYVKLERKDDKKSMSMQIAKFSEDDQTWVQNEMKMRDAIKAKQKKDESSKQKKSDVKR